MLSLLVFIMQARNVRLHLLTDNWDDLLVSCTLLNMTGMIMMYIGSPFLVKTCLFGRKDIGIFKLALYNFWGLRSICLILFELYIFFSINYYYYK